MSDAGEYMDALREGLTADEVFVFTPMGEVIGLPNGAVPVDFAYHIHSDIGNSMYGAKVNGRMVPLTYNLVNGDIVEILTSDKVRGPSRDWLTIVKSSTARSKISSWFKRERRDENIVRGRELLEREIHKTGFHTQDLLKKYLAPLLEALFAPHARRSSRPCRVRRIARRAYRAASSRRAHRDAA